LEKCPLAVVVTTLPSKTTPLNELGFRLPATLDAAGEHKIKISTYIGGSGTATEEAEFFYHTTPKPLLDGSFEVNMKHKTEGLWNAVEVKLRTEIQVPVNGYV
jgi:hypothetical protein